MQYMEVSEPKWVNYVKNIMEVVTSMVDLIAFMHRYEIERLKGINDGLISMTKVNSTCEIITCCIYIYNLIESR